MLFHSVIYNSVVLLYSNPQGWCGGQFFLSIPREFCLSSDLTEMVYNLADFFQQLLWHFHSQSFVFCIFRLFL